MHIFRSLFVAALWSAPFLTVASEPDLPHQSKEWQIWAYSTAAPSFIGEHATVLDHNNDVLRPGSNGWTCMPGNARPMPPAGWPNAHQAMPVCADAESEVDAGLLSERIPELAHDGFMWMLHAMLVRTTHANDNAQG